MNEKKAPPEKEAALKQILADFKGVSTATQVDRLREAFHQFPSLSTVEIRAHLDIIHPAGRVKTLREEGMNIVTLWTLVQSEDGDTHRVANYLLVVEAAYA